MADVIQSSDRISRGPRSLRYVALGFSLLCACAGGTASPPSASPDAGRHAEVISLLLEMNDPGEQVRASAANRLRRYGKDALPPLVSFLRQSGNSYFRESGVRVLAEIGGKAFGSVIEELALAEAGKYDSVRLEGANVVVQANGALPLTYAIALQKTRGKDCVPILLKCCRARPSDWGVSLASFLSGITPCRIEGADPYGPVERWWNENGPYLYWTEPSANVRGITTDGEEVTATIGTTSRLQVDEAAKSRGTEIDEYTRESRKK
jgi:hypothetical protein